MDGTLVDLTPVKDKSPKVISATTAHFDLLASLQGEEATAISSLSVLSPIRPSKVARLRQSGPNRRHLMGGQKEDEASNEKRMRCAVQQRLHPQPKLSERPKRPQQPLIVNRTCPLRNMMMRDLQLLRQQTKIIDAAREQYASIPTTTTTGCARSQPCWPPPDLPHDNAGEIHPGGPANQTLASEPSNGASSNFVRGLFDPYSQPTDSRMSLTSNNSPKPENRLPTAEM
jgi:hypothetical protein